MSSRQALFFTVLLSLSSIAAGQNPASEPAPSPKDSYVIESRQQNISFANDGTGEEEQTGRIRITSQAGLKAYSIFTITYAKSTDTVDPQYFRVRKPDGRVVVTPADYLQDMPSDVTRAAPEYSDLYEKHVAIKALEVGDTFEYDVRITHKPLVPGQFWHAAYFDRNEIVKDAALVVSIPASRPIKLRSVRFQPVISEKDGRKIYTWKWSNTSIEKAPVTRHQPPPDVLISTFQSWEEMGRWWADMSVPRVTDSPEIKAKAESLTKDAKTDEERALLLYDWVSTRIHYIGVSFGIGRYQPHSALEVLQNGYGDCKDKHTLLAAMLQAVGIPAVGVLVNAEREIDPDVPTPMQFDHAITLATIGGKQVWLDTTMEVGPFGYLITPLRDRWALVADSKKPQLVRTPAGSPGRRVYRAEATVDEKGHISGKIEWNDRGDTEFVFRTLFRTAPPAKWSDVAQMVSYGSGFGGKVSDVRPGDPEKTHEPFTLSYKYEREDYGKWDERQTYPLLPASGLADSGKEKSDSDDAKPDKIYLGAQSLNVDAESHLKFPKGITAKAPEDVEYKSDFAEYRSHSEYANGVLKSTRHLIVLKSELPLDREDDVKKFRKTLYDDENRFISLEGAADIQADKASPDQLYSQIRTAWTKQNWSKVEELLAELEKREPNSDRVLALKTGLSMVRGKGSPDSALRDAIKKDPKNIAGYQGLVAILYNQHKYEEALAVAKQAVQAMPDRAESYWLLGTTEAKLEHHKESATAYGKAAELAPDNNLLQSYYATELIKSGDKEKATAVIEQNIPLLTDPLLLNDWAYVMADGDIHVEQALALSRRSVEEQQKKLSGVTLATASQEAVQNLSALTAYWDTLGWIYFRQGDMQNALKYVLPAWQLDGSGEVGDHLAQIYEALGQTDLARQVYALAAAAGDNAPEVRRHFAKLVPASAIEKEIAAARPNISKSRELVLKYKPDQKQSGEFLLHLQNRKVEEATLQSGDSELKAATDTILATTMPAFDPPTDTALDMIRTAIVFCPGHGADCQFVLSPLANTVVKP